MGPQPRRHPEISVLRPSGPVTAVAVVLHGGRADSREAVRRTQPAVLRMVPFARALSGAAGRGRGGAAGASGGLAVWTVRYRLRGWNGPEASPVADARWVLDRVRARHGDVPVVLIGHSMGARTALRVAGDASVRGVAALAPWVPDHEPVAHLAGTRVMIIHGDCDLTTDPAASLRYAQRAADAGVDVTRIEVRGEGHAMLRRAGLWHRLATAFALDVLADVLGHQSAPPPATNLLRTTARGRLRFVVE